MLTYKTSLPLQALAILTFGLYLAVAVELSLQLTALINLSLSLGITLILPQIALSLALTLALIVQFNIALGLSLPDLVINFSLAIEFELTIVLGLLATLNLILEGVAGASLVGYAYIGSGLQLGPSVQQQIGAGWPDGTPSDQNVTVFLFVATASGPLTPDQVDTASLVPPPATPPTPPPPSPPAGSYPPPQAYEHGLASVSFPSQTYPTLVYPADPARGALTIDDSVSAGIGAITGITITHNGAGYPGPAICMISDTVDIVHASTGSPIVVTLPNPLSIPIGKGLGITIGSVMGSTVIVDATNETPVVITVVDTTNLQTAFISGALGNTAINGQWHCKILSGTQVALYSDKELTIPSSGSGAYTGGGKLCGNINGLQNAKVLTSTTVALYADPMFTTPVVGFGTYTGGTVTGGGTGAVGNVTMGGGAKNALKSFFSGLLWPNTQIGPALVGGKIPFQIMLGTTFDLLLKLLSNLKSRASLLAAASASASIAVIPPTLNASIELAGKIVANLKANLTIKPPQLGIAASAALSGQLGLIGALSAGVSFMLGIGNVDLEIWEYQGPGSGLAAAIAAGPGAAGWHDGTPASNVVAAGVFGLTTGASLKAFTSFFGGLT